MLKIEEYSYENDLKKINLSIEPGEITGIIGKAGSGKSALLHGALGLGKKGSPMINGKKIKRMSSKNKNLLVSSIPSGQIENLSDTVYFYLLLSRMPYKKFFKPFSDLDHQITEKYIEALGLEKYETMELGTLSASVLRMVLLAWCFIREAPLLIFENPDLLLNPDQKFKLFETINRYTMNGDRSVLMTSNDINTVSQCADRIIILEDGLIAEEGPPEILTKDIIEKYFNCSVLVSRNIYNGRPEVHLFPPS